MGALARAVPHPDDVRAAALAPVDQDGAASTTRRPGLGAAGRVLLEVLAFRSLFRNNRSGAEGRAAGSRYRPTSGCGRRRSPSTTRSSSSSCATSASSPSRCRRSWRWSRGWTASSRWAVPIVYLTDIVLVAALGYLLWRRLADPAAALHLAPRRLLPAGAAPRGRASGRPPALRQQGGRRRRQGPGDRARQLPPGRADRGRSPLVFVHIFLVSVLLAYFPFSKLVHMAGRLPLPDAQPRQRQPEAPPHQPVEPADRRAHLRRVGGTSSTTSWWPRGCPSTRSDEMPEKKRRGARADRLHAAPAGLDGPRHRLRGAQGHLVLPGGRQEPALPRLPQPARLVAQRRGLAAPRELAADHPRRAGGAPRPSTAR